MSIMVGTGHGARNGVLVKKAEALETLEKVNAIVVDKTGTLTEGKPTVQQVLGYDEHDETEVLALASSLERFSEHPLAAAIVNENVSRNGRQYHVTDFHSITGSGVEGVIEGKKVGVFSGHYSDGKSYMPTMSDEAADQEMQYFVDGNRPISFVDVIVDGISIGGIAITDALKPSALAAVDELHKRGIEVVMMTGDNRLVAEIVAGQLGIKKFFAQVLPEDKAAKVKELQSQRKIVAMAGDGVNDAPALAQADVGIAFASGTDVAMESADITLLRPDLDGILKAINLSRATMKNIRQNLFFAFIYNLVGVPIAAGVLFPVFGLLLSPMIASAAMTFSSVSVIMNALRLRNAKL
jgi:heavy metal translocating P-type ATPase